ncbi:MAG: oligosaccharide flippase family protein [Paludibacteraceae bacterium]|nr:oligosaccharide flippase family protein [Paludibacteraceae bacterium]
MIRTIFNKLNLSIFFKNTSIVLFSNLISRGLGLITFILLAKYLSVSTYSALALILALIITLTDLINSGLNASVVRYTAIYKAHNQSDKISKLLSTTLINAITISCVIILVVFFLKNEFNIFFIKDGNYQPELFIASFGILTTFFLSIYAGIIQGLQSYFSLFVGSVLFSIIRLILILILLFTDNFKVNHIVLMFVIAPIPSILYYHLKLKLYVPNRILYDRHILKETFTFGRWMILWSIVTIIQSKLDLYLQGALSTPEHVSYFDVATKFVSVPLSAFIALGTVLNPKLASLNALDIPKILPKIMLISLAMTIVLFIGCLISPAFVSFFFEKKYIASYTPLQIMLLGLIPYVWCLPYTSALFAIGKSSAFFWTALFGLAINTVSSFYLIPKLGSTGSAISYCIVNSLSFCLIYFLYRKHLKLCFAMQTGNSNKQ